MSDENTVTFTHEQFRVFAKRVSIMARDRAVFVMQEISGRTIFAPDLKTVAVDMGQSEVVFDLLIRLYLESFKPVLDDPLMALWQHELTQSMATVQIALDNGWQRGKPRKP